MTVSSYDDIVYPSFPYQSSHPEHLATVARLFGLRSPPADGCRVLELGCAAGGNLLPIAEMFPKAEFVGIDLSARQVAMGQSAVQAIGLTNLDLRTASITDVTLDWGRFDYILCHGVYSWVPDVVQDKILDIYRQNLSPEGVGYVSYNTYPGWHMRGMLREIMCFHAARFTQSTEQVREARELLDFLAEASAGANTAYELLLKQETQLLRQQSDAYLFHEHLEEHNSPCYFYEFAEKVRANGLQYLGDAAFQTMLPGNHPPKVLEKMSRLARDLIQLEQYLDFVRNRTFRSSLVCAADLPLVRNIDVDLLQDMHFSSSAARATAPAEPGATGVLYKFEAGTLTVTDPLMIATLDAVIRAWPCSVPFDQLADSLASAGVAPTAAGRHQLSATLMTLFTKHAINASVSPARCVGTVSNTPAVTPVALHLMKKEGWMPTRRHTVFRPDEIGRRMISLLDGRRTRDEVVGELHREFKADRLRLQHNGVVERDPTRARALLVTGLANTLEHLRAAGGLVG